MILGIKKSLNKFALPIIFVTLLFSRFLYLDFGLPEVYQADEVEMVEYSLKYAVNLKKFFEGDLYFFKPFSFVYGSLPAYFNTVLLVPFLKFTSFFELSQDRYYIYLYLRIIYALLSVFTCIGVYLVAKKITKKENLSYFSAILFSLNYYYLWLSKYLNNDVIILLFLVYFVYFYLSYKEDSKKRNLFISAIFLGLGVATKITFGIVILYPVVELILNKQFKKVSLYISIIFFIYLITNPFTFIFPIEFINRILEMRVKENGIVIDSYNTSYFKYFFSLVGILNSLVTILGLYKVITDIRENKFNITTYIITIFIIFFSFSNRLVDRWLLPIYPFIIINFVVLSFNQLSKTLRDLSIGMAIVLTSVNFINTNLELSNGANLQKAYFEFINNSTQPGKIVYIVTERGLNPFGYVIRKDMMYAQAPVNLYVSNGAFESFPDNPSNYDFIVLSSRVVDYYSNPYIFELNPGFVSKWGTFFNDLYDSRKYEIIGFYGKEGKSFVNQENITIFKKISTN